MVNRSLTIPKNCAVPEGIDARKPSSLALPLQL
jgi:hypothetical protein